MPIILDACAIIAFLRDEDGAENVERALLNDECMVHALNLCEVYKDCLSRGEKAATADQMVDDLTSAGLIVREDMDEEIWKYAARIKAQLRRISYADCFALALCCRVNGVLYTSDHRDFDPLQSKYSIHFIR